MSCHSATFREGCLPFISTPGIVPIIEVDVGSFPSLVPVFFQKVVGRRVNIAVSKG